MNVGRWTVEVQEEEDEDEEEEIAVFSQFSEVFDRRAFVMDLGHWSWDISPARPFRSTTGEAP